MSKENDEWLGDKSCLKELEEYRSKARSAKQLKRIDCVYYRAKYMESSVDIAKRLGMHEVSVRKLQSKYIREGIQALLLKPQGGRKRENMSVEEEKAFLKKYQQKANQGRISTPLQIWQDYQNQLGRAAGKSTLYAVLARHNWGKGMPRPRHIKQEPEAIPAFKKSLNKS